MPNMSRAHSLHLSLCSVLGEVELQHIVVFNLYKKQLFCYFWKKKKPTRHLGSSCTCGVRVTVCVWVPRGDPDLG